MSEEGKLELKEDQFLKIDNLRLKFQNSLTALEALTQRRNALSVEAQVLPERIKKAEESKDALQKQFEAEYTKLKEELEVPEGLELNFESGQFEKRAQ